MGDACKRDFDRKEDVMQKRLISTLILTAYSAALIKLLVFKITLINIGPLRFRFAPRTGEANLIPLNSILSYLRGEPLSLIAILNLVGNIALLVPIGFLVPFVYRDMTWRKSLALAVAVGLAIEGMEVVFRVGIFDIDDVILNALGVMVGYLAFAGFGTWARPRSQSS
ncbi:MAG: VanZ family protein [Caulobacteraceae bacterium]|nr:VanZ family protein [Caulobacteraceae bacterium]